MVKLIEGFTYHLCTMPLNGSASLPSICPSCSHDSKYHAIRDGLVFCCHPQCAGGQGMSAILKGYIEVDIPAGMVSFSTDRGDEPIIKVVGLPREAMTGDLTKLRAVPYQAVIALIKAYIKNMAESKSATTEEYGALTQVLEFIDQTEEQFDIKPIVGGDANGKGKKGNNKKGKPGESQVAGKDNDSGK